MNKSELPGILAFLREAGRLKDTLRSGSTMAGRRESTADHSWRLCLMAMVLAPGDGSVDVARLLKMLVVHDLGEALSGDTPAPDQAADPCRKARERADLERLVAPLPERLRAELLALHDDYEAGTSEEARLAKGLDKLETIMTHAQGANPPDFDHGFNLAYGRAATDRHPLTAALRPLFDAMTRERMSGEAP